MEVDINVQMDESDRYYVQIGYDRAMIYGVCVCVCVLVMSVWYNIQRFLLNVLWREKFFLRASSVIINEMQLGDLKYKGCESEKIQYFCNYCLALAKF